MAIVVTVVVRIVVSSRPHSVASGAAVGSGALGQQFLATISRTPAGDPVAAAIRQVIPV